MNYTAFAISDNGVIAILQTNLLGDCHDLFLNLHHRRFTARILTNKTGFIYREFDVIDGQYYLK